MFKDIISVENLFTAWRIFRRGKRDKPDVQLFERHLEDNLFALHDELRGKLYQHGSYARFHLFDPKHRIIHKAEVRDRVVHHAVYRILAPFFERSFIFDSYSCRLDKGTHAGVDRLEQLARKASRNYTRTCFALKCDIRKFFDSIDHSILMNIITRRISDPNTLWLIAEIIASYSSCDNLTRESKGLPIGNLTSQLFANLYLNEFDHFVKEKWRGEYYIPYTDDFVILHENPIALASLLPVMRAYSCERLALELHSKKIELRKLRQGIDFIGYVVLPHYRVLRTSTKRRMWKKLLPWDGDSFDSVESYLGMLKHCNSHKLSKELREATNYDECWNCGVIRPF